MHSNYLSRLHIFLGPKIRSSVGAKQYYIIEERTSAILEYADDIAWEIIIFAFAVANVAHNDNSKPIPLETFYCLAEGISEDFYEVLVCRLIGGVSGEVAVYFEIVVRRAANE